MFLFSASAGVWIAYDKPAAWAKFGLVVGGLIVYAVLAHLPEQIHIGPWNMPALEWILGSLPTLVAIYFMLTNDWSSRIGKVPVLDPAMRWFSAWQPNLSALGVNSNVIGGVIAALLPLQMAALFQAQTRKSIWIKAALTAVSGIGLLMSASRGAWLALIISATAWGLWHLINRVSPQRTRSHDQTRTVWGVTLAVILLSVSFVLVLTPWGDRLLALRSDRQAVWRNSLDLVSDYPFTGLGLGGFEMAYSSYVLLVHVPHTAHAHNLFLDIWLEQGLLGLLAFGGLVIQAVRPKASASRWRVAAWAALGVVVLHGMLDDPFYGYGGRAIPLLFVPLGVAVRPVQVAVPFKSRAWRSLVFGGASIVAALLVTTLLPSLRAAWEANLGTLAQTQIELSIYNEKWGMQDVLRRSPRVNLTPAVIWYQAALALDPTNATANRRMGQIELSQGHYDMARQNLEMAYATAPGQRATRQLLGECYAIAGEIDRAAALWRTVDVGQGQLGLRRSWYVYLGEEEHAVRIDQGASAIGN